MAELAEYLKVVVEKNASDLYIISGSPPMIRVEGKVSPLSNEKLNSEDTERLVKSILNERQIDAFYKKPEVNLAYSAPGLGRFRVNVYSSRNSMGLVARRVKLEIETLDNLHLPPILKDIIMLRQGLVIVTGATGTGKSTTLAAMIDHRNSNATGHIITVEDPIEFLHQHKKSIVMQREIGVDTVSYQDALKNALRQAPDLILIGEMRDLETVESAIHFAETGHLVLSTLHSINASQTLERILNFFPLSTHPQVLLQLSLNLRAIISQRLIPKMDETGRVPAIEVLINSPRVKELIRRGEITMIKTAIEEGVKEGMQGFDQHLYQLYKNDLIDEETAIHYADSPNNLRLRMKGITSPSVSSLDSL